MSSGRRNARRKKAVAAATSLIVLVGTNCAFSAWAALQAERSNSESLSGLGEAGNPGPLAQDLVDEFLESSDLLADAFSLLEARFGTDDLVLEVLLRTREAARQRRAFSVADALRDQLILRRGMDVEDSRAGASCLRTHRDAAKKAAKAAEAMGSAARELALAALEQSLLADSQEEVQNISCSAAAGVQAKLRSPAARAAIALPGRQSSDLALSLALAGCDDIGLFENLAAAAQGELERSRSSNPIAVAQITERLAAAGFRQEDCPDLFGTARALLQRLQLPQSSSTMRDLEAGNFSLHSERPMLWLFRHALRQGRRCIPPADASQQASAALAALDTGSRHLVLDLGCGFGVSGLGLAQSGRCVFGVDASAHCIGFGQALARRWNICPDQLQLEQCSAMQALSAARKYRGPVEWVLVNFPTPFSERQGTISGNSHLPQNIRSADFMANAAMLRSIGDLLEGGDGTLLVQSNVEDLAVSLRTMAESEGWEALGDGCLGPEVEGIEETQVWQSKRQARHIEQGGLRAAGPGWLASSPLPKLSMTETEAYYTKENLPIHRVALKPPRRKACKWDPDP